MKIYWCSVYTKVAAVLEVMTLFNLTACGGKTENTNKKSWAENNGDR